MPDQDDDTLSKPPQPLRPEWGWSAWMATVGYLAAHHSPDARLRLQVYQRPDHLLIWSAALLWGDNAEQVQERASYAAALRDLWREVCNYHTIFKSEQERVLQPQDYREDRWLDEKTNDVLERLLRVTEAVFAGDWRLLIVYQPGEQPDNRVLARMLAKETHVQRAGRGPTLRDACRNLYQNTAGTYAAHLRRDKG